MAKQSSKSSTQASSGFSYGSGKAQVQLEHPLFLAPMAGSTELSFRRICHRFGSAQGVTELVSARGINYGGLESSMRYLEIDPATEGPVAIQLFGFDPADFRIATERILNDPQLSSCVAIDINMGCPVQKVRKTGAGVSLMDDPHNAAAIVKATKAVAAKYDKAVTVKCRTGIEKGGPQSLQVPEFAVAMADAGADLITVHARSAEQFYRGKADWSWMPKVRKALDQAGHQAIPLVGNGDIDSAQNLKKRMEQGAVQAYMVGRAAQGAPWIFAELLAAIEGKTWKAPTSEERAEVIYQHFQGLEARLGEQKAALEFRSLLAMYLKGARGASTWRGKTSHLKSRAELEALLEQFVEADIWEEG